MTIVRADYFDGKSSERHPVTLVFRGGKLRVVGQAVNAEFDVRRVRRSLPIGGTPRWFYLPGGGACVTSDVGRVERVSRKRLYERTLQKWESRPLYAGFAVALVVATFWLIVDYGVPAGARVVAERIPVEAEAALGRESLAGLDQHFMKPSRLSAERQRVLREKLDQMVKASGATVPYRLEFRASPVFGANAFALPSGIIVMADELVKLARNDREILGVLAHELGHLHHRHTMRRLLEASATALIIAGVTGDLASASSLAASAPTLLLQTKYSRGNEREADIFAIDMLRKAGINPRALGDILARLEGKSGRGGIPDFLSSHPATEERVALSRANDGKAEPEPEEPEPERPKLAAIDPVQREVLRLLSAKDFSGLERELNAHLSAFERDSTKLPVLEQAFRAFGKTPSGGRADLDEWVKQMPRSYAAALASGTFHLHSGLEKAGVSPLAAAPKGIAGMQAELASARAEFERALGLASNHYLARQLLMTVARHAGDRKAEQSHYAEALRLAPRLVELRLEHMSALEPRFGGSYEQMQAYVEESRRDLGAPDLPRLAARLPASRAGEHARMGEWSRALALYDEAIALDPAARSLCGRARALAMQGKPAEALVGIERALALARDDRACLEHAIRIAGLMPSAHDVIRITQLVLEADPSAVDAYTQRGVAYEYIGKRDLAFKDFAEAARLGDAWAERQTERK